MKYKHRYWIQSSFEKPFPLYCAVRIVDADTVQDAEKIFLHNLAKEYGNFKFYNFLVFQHGEKGVEIIEAQNEYLLTIEAKIIKKLPKKK